MFRRQVLSNLIEVCEAIFADEKGIKKIDSVNPFEKLEKYYNSLPLSCGKLTIVLNNKFLHSIRINNTFQKGFLDYIND